MKSERSVVIDRRIEDVFRFALEDVLHWSNFVVQREWIDENAKGVGTRFRSVTEDRGRRMEYRGVITAFEPPYTLALRLNSQAFDVEAAYAFENLGYRTKVTQFSKVTGKGLAQPIFILLGWMLGQAFRDAQDKELRSLKQYCESQTS